MKRAIKTKRAKNCSGQAVMSDLFLATIVFIFLLTVIMFTRNSYEKRLDDNVVQDRLVMNSLQAAHVLTHTPGVPSDWENDTSTLSVVGLAERDRILSLEKVDSFFMLNYSQAQSVLKLTSFNMTLRSLGGDVIHSTAINHDSDVAVRIERRVLYNGSPALFVLEVWP